MPKVLPRWSVWLLLGLTLFLRGRALQTLSEGLKQDPDGYVAIAKLLDTKNTFAIRVEDDQPIPTAFRPPLYPCLISWLDPGSVMGRNTRIGILHFLIGVGTVLLVWRLGLRWQSSPKIALVAAVLVGIDPVLVQQSSQVMTETLATFLVVMTLFAFTIGSSRASLAMPFLAGGILGLAVLCRPTFLVWMFFVLLAGTWLALGWRKRVAFFSATLVGLLFVVQPWVIRNWVQFGQPILSTTHGGYTLLRGNNLYFYEHVRLNPWGIWDSRYFDQRWQDVSYDGSGDDELSRDKLAYEVAGEFMRREPRKFAIVSLYRLSRLYGLVPWKVDPSESWRGRWLRYSIGVFYFVEFALAIVGVITLGRQLLRPPWVWGTLLVLSFTLVHTFYWTDMRMRAPLVPVIALVAAVGAWRVWAWLRPARGKVAPREAQGLPSLGLG